MSLPLGSTGVATRNPHFMEERSEAQKGQLLNPRSHSWEVDWPP